MAPIDGLAPGAYARHMALERETAMAEQIADGRKRPLMAVLARVGGALAWVAAAGVGLILTLLFAATLMVVVVSAAAFVLAAAVVLGLRAPARRRDADVIEARHLGGHSWVAYGWDTRA
jgi:hypothetical protein